MTCPGMPGVGSQQELEESDHGRPRRVGGGVAVRSHAAYLKDVLVLDWAENLMEYFRD